MALTSGSGGKLPTWMVIVGLIILALVIAKASTMEPIPIQGITPSPTATTTK